MAHQGASHTEASGCLPAVIRLAWLVGGNITLIFLALAIAQRPATSHLDIIYWVIVVALVGLRYIDITRLSGLTKDGDPATLRDWRRYIVVLLVLSSGLWVLAHTALPRVMSP